MLRKAGMGMFEVYSLLALSHPNLISHTVNAR